MSVDHEFTLLTSGHPHKSVFFPPPAETSAAQGDAINVREQMPTEATQQIHGMTVCKAVSADRYLNLWLNYFLLTPNTQTQGGRIPHELQRFFPSDRLPLYRHAEEALRTTNNPYYDKSISPFMRLVVNDGRQPARFYTKSTRDRFHVGDKSQAILVYYEPLLAYLAETIRLELRAVNNAVAGANQRDDSHKTASFHIHHPEIEYLVKQCEDPALANLLRDELTHLYALAYNKVLATEAFENIHLLVLTPAFYYYCDTVVHYDSQPNLHMQTTSSAWHRDDPSVIKVTRMVRTPAAEKNQPSSSAPPFPDAIRERLTDGRLGDRLNPKKNTFSQGFLSSVLAKTDDLVTKLQWLDAAYQYLEANRSKAGQRLYTHTDSVSQGKTDTGTQAAHRHILYSVYINLIEKQVLNNLLAFSPEQQERLQEQIAASPLLQATDGGFQRYQERARVIRQALADPQGYIDKVQGQQAVYARIVYF